jgi:hypothetical protein
MRAGTMVDKNVLLQRYENSLGSEGKTRSLYLKTARDFLDNVDDFSRDSINKYLRQLRKKKEYSDGTINFHFRVIRTLFNRNQTVLAAEGIEWPFRRGDAPQIREEAITAPALDPDTIITMINTIKVDGEPDEKAFLALSTTYGLRREELQELTKDQVNLKDRTLYIATKKHGRERTHVIPEDILPALDGYKFPSVSEYKLLLIWYRMEHKIGLDHIDQVGFHCTPAGAPITTPEGIKPIEKIEKGDFVWGRGHASYNGHRTGWFSRVLDTFNYEYNGPLFKVKAHGLLELPPLTPNHPLLVKRRNVIAARSRGKKFRKNIEFVEVENIQKGDYLIVPKYLSKESPQILDFSPFVKKYGWGKNRHLKDGVFLDEDIAEFLGRYLADGAGSKGANQMYFGHEDYEGMQRMMFIIELKLGFKVRLDKQFTKSRLRGKETSGWCWRLQFGGWVLRRFLQTHIKTNSHDAMVPQFIFESPNNIVEAFLKGYFYGDGYINWNRRSITASTVCRDLALQLQLLATKVGIWLNVRNPESDKSRYTMEMSKSHGEKLFKGSTAIKTQGSPIMEDDNHFYCPVTAIEMVDYSGLVYNFETKQGNYCLNNAVSHNSIRRSLNTLLLNDFPETVVMSFLRWKQRTSSNMPFRYSAQKFVGLKGSTMQVVGEAKDVDSKIFERHPFIKYWGNGGWQMPMEYRK